MIDTTIDAAQLEHTVDAYFAAWNELDDEVRTNLVSTAFAADGRYVDPLSDATGHAAVAAMMGGVHAQFPGMSVDRTSAIDAHHDVIRFRWAITAADGSTMIDGVDVAQLTSDGHLADVRGFFGAVPMV